MITLYHGQMKLGRNIAQLHTGGTGPLFVYFCPTAMKIDFTKSGKQDIVELHFETYS